MLAYPLDEAEQLLDSKLKAAKQSLANCEEDLDFLREQITVSAHNICAISGHCADCCRPWRSPSRECTTGTSYKSARRRRRKRGGKERAHNEDNYGAGRRSSSHDIPWKENRLRPCCKQPLRVYQLLHIAVTCLAWCITQSPSRSPGQLDMVGL